MQALRFFTIVVLLLFNLKLQAQQTIALTNGHIERINSFVSNYSDARRVDVWLPPDYGKGRKKRYAVIYMQDGQNLFVPEYAYGGNEWQADETITRLTATKRIKDCIVVGIWNTPKRFREYQPDKVYQLLPDSSKKKVSTEYGGEPLGDGYLKFMVKELKPYIDKHYRTLKDKNNTCVMGSSMGGIIALYAICEYPDVFGRAGCISTHWPISIKHNEPEYPAMFVKYLQTHLPPVKGHKIYFDRGTRTLDAWYEPYQEQVDALFAKKWPKLNWLTLKFEGDEHSETSWSKRFNQPLEFLLGIK